MQADPAPMRVPTLDELIVGIGEVGHRLAEIEATEGAAGNLSILVGKGVEGHPSFTEEERISLPVEVPELEDGLILVTGSGRRLREIGNDPFSNLIQLRILKGGKEAVAMSSPRRWFEKPTSELNTHLALHARFHDRATGFHAVVHAQPLHLTFLSHVPRYQNEDELNRRVLRWQPETIWQMPEGIGVLPFMIPGSEDLMKATTTKMDPCQLVIWGKHGVVARSGVSAKHATDLIEYAETGAKYEFLNLSVGEQAEGLTGDEMKWIANTFGLKQRFF